jgi:hypothetical protein
MPPAKKATGRYSGDAPRAAGGDNTPTGQWASGPPSADSTDDAARASAPAPAGMEISPAVDDSPSMRVLGFDAPGKEKLGGPDNSSSTIPDSLILKAITGLRSELLERVGDVERRLHSGDRAFISGGARDPSSSRSDSRGGTGAPGGAGHVDSEGSFSSTSSRSSNDSSADSQEPAGFVPINASKPPGGARDRASDNDQEPRRYSLYGNKVFDSLTRGHEGGGLLGFALQYAEPICLYLFASVEYLENICEADLDQGTMLFELERVVNSNRALYSLVNTFRELLVTKARAVRSGASEYDKAEAKFVERSMDERDFGTDDVPTAIADLKADFAFASRKADLNTLAKRGSGGGAGPSRRDRDPDASERRGSRGERARGDRARGSRGGKKHRDRRDEDDRRDDRRDGSRTSRDRRDGKSGGRDDKRARETSRDADDRRGSGKGADGGKGSGKGSSGDRGNSSRADAERGERERGGGRGSGRDRGDGSSRGNGKQRAGASSSSRGLDTRLDSSDSE